MITRDTVKSNILRVLQDAPKSKQNLDLEAMAETLTPETVPLNYINPEGGNLYAATWDCDITLSGTLYIQGKDKTEAIAKAHNILQKDRTFRQLLDEAGNVEFAEDTDGISLQDVELIHGVEPDFWLDAYLASEKIEIENPVGVAGGNNGDMRNLNYRTFLFLNRTAKNRLKAAGLNIQEIEACYGRRQDLTEAFEAKRKAESNDSQIPLSEAATERLLEAVKAVYSRLTEEDRAKFMDTMLQGAGMQQGSKAAIDSDALPLPAYGKEGLLAVNAVETDFMPTPEQAEKIAQVKAASDARHHHQILTRAYIRRLDELQEEAIAAGVPVEQVDFSRDDYKTQVEAALHLLRHPQVVITSPLEEDNAAIFQPNAMAATA